MTASNPTPDDLRTIANNMIAEEGKTSRAEVIMNAAKRMERLELYISQFHEFAKEISQGIKHDMERITERIMEYFMIEEEE